MHNVVGVGRESLASLTNEYKDVVYDFVAPAMQTSGRFESGWLT